MSQDTFFKTCDSQEQGPRVVTLVIADIHFDLLTGSHIAKYAHYTYHSISTSVLSRPLPLPAQYLCEQDGVRVSSLLHPHYSFDIRSQGSRSS